MPTVIYVPVTPNKLPKKPNEWLAGKDGEGTNREQQIPPVH
jgi:hypothetical protein